MERSDLLETSNVWQIWEFDQELRLGFDRRQQAAPGLNQNVITEEGLETLLLLNIGKVFPDWHLRLYSKADNLWSATDIEACDPIGRQHIFELKYGQAKSRKYAISQLLHYGLQASDRTGGDWFDQTVETDWLAQRILGFWRNERTETDGELHDRNLEPGERRARIVELLADRFDDPEVTVEEARNWARRWKKTQMNSDKVGFGGGRDHPNGLCLHLVLPNHAVIDEGELEVLGRLKDRGLDVHVWEVRVALDESRRCGELATRELPLHPVKKSGREVRDYAEASDPRASVVLSSLCEKYPRLRAERIWNDVGECEEEVEESRWSLDSPRSFSLKVPPPIRPVTANGYRLKFTISTEKIEIKANFSNPGHVDDTKSGLQKHCIGPLHTIRDWVVELAPPLEDEVERKLNEISSASKNWQSFAASSLDAGSVDGWHSGGRKQSSVTIKRESLFSESQLGPLVEICRQATEAFVKQVVANRQTERLDGPVS